MSEVLICNFQAQCDHGISLARHCCDCERLALWHGIRSALLFIIPFWSIIGLILIRWLR